MKSFTSCSTARRMRSGAAKLSLALAGLSVVFFSSAGAAGGCVTAIVDV